jgi:hypothetical protein
MSTKEDPVDLEGGKRSAWMTHVKKTMRAHKGMKLMQVLKMAKKTYKKSRRGGASAVVPHPVGGEGSGAPAGAAPVGGRRVRKGSRKSRGTRKH